MALFSTPQEHAANPPETWEVVKIVPGLWHLRAKGSVDGVCIDSRGTKKDAEQLKVEGFYVNLYEKERRWYAGEEVAGWKPYRED